MLCLSGFELYSRLVSLCNAILGIFFACRCQMSFTWVVVFVMLELTLVYLEVPVWVC